MHVSWSTSFTGAETSASLNVCVSNWNVSYVRVIVQAILLSSVMYNECSDYVLLLRVPQTV